MKSIMGLLAFAIATSTAVSATASQALVCQNTTQKLETLIAVNQLKNGSYTMTVYKTIAGRSVAPQTEMVRELPGTRGAVVAYGNKEQTQILVLNLARRDSKNRIFGTYTNSIQNEVLEVTCN